MLPDLTKKPAMNFIETSVNIPPTLTKNEFRELIVEVNKSITAKLTALNNPEELTLFLTTFCSNPLHTLLTPRTVEALYDDVFSSVKVTEFVLSITAEFMITVALNDYRHERVVKTIADALSLMSIDRTVCLLPEQIKQTLDMSDEEIYLLLESNAWLLTLLFIYLSFKD